MFRREPSPAVATAACIDACLAAAADLRRLGEHLVATRGHGPPARLMRDCAEVCTATAEYMRSESAFRARMLAACAELCDECAVACAAAPGLAAAVAACRRCAESCRAARAASPADG